MQRRTTRLWLAALAAFLLVPAPAAAQVLPDPPAVISPLKVEPDRNGVNLNTGKITIDVPSLGVPAAPRLHWDRVQNAAPYMRGTIITGDTPVMNYSATTIDGSSESFGCYEFECGSVAANGSTFVGTGIHHQNGRYQRGNSGEVYHFNLTSVDSVANTTRTVQSYASDIVYPDGEKLFFSYDTVGCTTGVTCYRPNRIETNAGYFITVSYWCDDISQICWSEPKDAILYAASAPTTPLQSLHYDYAAGTVTDIGGRVWHVSGLAGTLGSNIEGAGGTVQLPTETSNMLTVAPVSGLLLVGSVDRDGVGWNYAYLNAVYNPRGNFGDYRYDRVTVTGPNGYSMAYDMGSTGFTGGWRNITTKSTDALGRQTSYGYDSDARLTKVTLPEGNYTQLGYDACGNVLTKTSVAKAGSGLANIVESAVYPDDSNCRTLGVLQFRPSSFTDARGKVTNYSWNSDGQLLQQLDPADTAGVRRQTDVTYTTVTPPLGGAISRKTTVRVCNQTTPPATCASPSASHTDYTYFGYTFLPATVTVTDDATGVSETTTYTYDNAGRVTSVQGPQNGVSGTKYFRYDIYGRKIWEIGASDASGKRLAKNFFYRDSDDKVYRVNTGTVTCASDCNTDPLTLSLLEQLDYTIDGRRNVVRDKRRLSSTNYTVTDRTFLDRGLLECGIVRMNVAVLPSSITCTLGTAGTDGPDRITKNTYDNAGQLLKVQKAYLITTANGFPANLQQDYVTYAYTPNGKQQFVTDANGNKAQFTWDGFDRLIKWNFPSPTTAGTVSTTDYEQYTYDPAGNRLSLRRRDGRTLTFTYDNLNRMLSKLVPDGCPPIQPVGTGCPAASATGTFRHAR